VRNESPVIGRCLDSVSPFVDRWVIVDTGSTDGTQGLVREHMASRPGELHERPWKSFDHNRNEALVLAKDKADYLFFIDADEALHLPSGFARPALGGDAYSMNCEYAGTLYRRCALIASRLGWRWEGVVHEYLTCSRSYRMEHLDGPRIVVSHEGARSRDPTTYAKDAALLEAALRTDPTNARSTFYLAQSYRDAGSLEQSRGMYRRRASMGGWDEEVWFSLYQIAIIGERLGASAAETSFGYLAAFQFRPTRGEPLVQLARFHRDRKEYALAFLYARRALELPRPSDQLFIDETVYLWRALDEFAIAAYFVGALDEGKKAIERLLAEKRFPESDNARIFANARYFGIE
jgi:glycosyltransferase involved in cell wall biosynthesis